jgi:hypothetical protein
MHICVGVLLNILIIRVCAGECSWLVIGPASAVQWQVGRSYLGASGSVAFWSNSSGVSVELANAGTLIGWWVVMGMLEVT